MIVLHSIYELSLTGIRSGLSTGINRARTGISNNITRANVGATNFMMRRPEVGKLIDAGTGILSGGTVSTNFGSLGQRTGREMSQDKNTGLRWGRQLAEKNPTLAKVVNPIAGVAGNAIDSAGFSGSLSHRLSRMGSINPNQTPRQHFKQQRQISAVGNKLGTVANVASPMYSSEEKDIKNKKILI